MPLVLGTRGRMTKYYTTMITALLLSAAVGGPALALDNPLVVGLHGMKNSAPAASATIFGSGSSVLVNVTGDRLPNGVAITLNDGDCANPGDIAFALSALADSGSLTKLEHSLSEVAGKAKSLVIHQTSSLTSPALACGKVTG
jgi:hypothetical protein